MSHVKPVHVNMIPFESSPVFKISPLSEYSSLPIKNGTGPAKCIAYVLHLFFTPNLKNKMTLSLYIYQKKNSDSNKVGVFNNHIFFFMCLPKTKRKQIIL